jgi:hypothetical protein
MSELALLGGPKTKRKPFPEWPQYDEKERRALHEVLESRLWWRTEGTKTLEFERAFARYHGAKHGIAVTNGTAAIEIVMAALKVGPGDEVIVPDSTFVATASAVLFAGAMPVMVDVRPDTDCIDPDLVEAAITPRTKEISSQTETLKSCSIPQPALSTCRGANGFAKQKSWPLKEARIKGFGLHLTQKINFAPNCIVRARWAPVASRKVALVRLLSTPLNCVWLKTLNKSQRNSNALLSLIGKCLKMLISKLVVRGLVSELRPEFPKVSPCG